ncbi:MAG: hypothetical protein HY869_01175 [Chloroflexi bacterium]|nr:hypothetical protein [Chloroflexota bacterium]
MAADRQSILDRQARQENLEVLRAWRSPLWRLIVNRFWTAKHARKTLKFCGREWRGFASVFKENNPCRPCTKKELPDIKKALHPARNILDKITDLPKMKTNVRSYF